MIYPGEILSQFCGYFGDLTLIKYWWFNSFSRYKSSTLRPNHV